MKLEEAIGYINAHTWSQWKLGLSRTRELLRLLGDPQKKLRFVHVAGSNGKGSTCAMLERILREAGYVTGLYPSPYIEDFRERIQVSGEYIGEEALCRITERVKELADGMEDHPTQFELITAIGMVYFEEKKCDIVLLEVGLGGTFDSTNVIDAPEAAVIVNIGLEHTEYLGNTLAEIAGNKCGIIKTGSEVICYENVPEVMEVVERACAEKGCRLHIARFGRVRFLGRSLDGQEFEWLPEEPGAGMNPVEGSPAGLESALFSGGLREGIDTAEGSPAGLDPALLSGEPGAGIGDGIFRLALLGEYQLHNAATALTVIEVLRGRGFVIPPEAVRRGLRNVRWPARFEVLSKDPLFILDGGHNPQCAQGLADSLLEYLPLAGAAAEDSQENPQADDRLPSVCRAVFLMGMLSDKDYRRVIDIVSPFSAGFVCLTPDSPRALPAKKLAELLQQRGFSALPCASAPEGIAAALALAQNLAGDPACGGAGSGSAVHCLPVIAFGSLYMAGEVRKAFPAALGAFFQRDEQTLRRWKEIQRREALARRRGLTPGERAQKSAAVCRLLREMPELSRAGTVFSYASAPDEVDLDDLNRALEEDGRRVCFPLTETGGRMTALLPGAAKEKESGQCRGADGEGSLADSREGTGEACGSVDPHPTTGTPSCMEGEGEVCGSADPGREAAWKTGVFGIREPVRERAVLVAPEEIDLVLVPCVAFDKRGGRCGHGAGYYDRYLEKLRPDVPKILIAFDVQETALTAAGGLDIRMDAVVTESGVTRISRRGSTQN